MFCSLDAQQLEVIWKVKDTGGLVPHGRSVKKPDVVQGLSEEQENIQDTSKVSAGTRRDFRLRSSTEVK